MLPQAVAGLPIAAALPEVQVALRHSNVLVHAEPGAGKSTGLPFALLPHASPQQKILLLEPRRLAARAVAQRLASLLNEPLGQTVGLRMRGATHVSDATVMEVVTEGVLTRLLQTDPELTTYHIIIFDEFHERSLHADLALALCLDVQQSLREDLRLVFMSATLSTELLATHLEEHRATSLQPLQSVHAEGRQHPVDIRWWGPVPSRSAGHPAQQQTLHVLKAVMDAVQQEQGDVLVFLPGVAEIERTAQLLQVRLSEHNSDVPIEILQLHSRVDDKTQKRATAPAQTQQRRIILSTSLAETSLTIDGVRVVVDSGLERRGRCDSVTSASRLETVPASQASAVQRAGRAGRTAPGVCYRLWTEENHSRRARSWEAEVLRADLMPVIMELASWGVDSVAGVPWLEVPSTAAADKATALLNNLRLMDGVKLTPLGDAVSALPVHPRLGAMVLWAQQGHALSTACELAVRLESGTSGGSIDLHSQLAARCTPFQKQQIAQLKNRVVTLPCVSASSQESMSGSPSLGVLVACAFPDWIAKRRPGIEARYTLACGAGVVLSNEDPLSQAPWLAVGSMGGASGAGKDARVFSACVLDMDELEAQLPHLLQSVRVCEWDDGAERVIAEQQIRVGRLVVQSKPIHAITDEDKLQALLGAIRKRGLTCLPWTDDLTQWQWRVYHLRRSVSAVDADAIPSMDDASLLERLEDWLPAWLNGISSFKALLQMDLNQALRSQLTYTQQQLLDEWCPARYSVPSGSSVKLRYSEQDVVLSVKLQEMFGCTVNPSVANGAIPLKIELLSPARRPVQITSDLVNFWQNSYPAVKKDMAGRYPKHPWPDDPLKAQPSARAKPRKAK